MTGEKVYDCYTYAMELGFTEREARDIAASKTGRGQDATVLRRMARAKGLIPAEAKPATEGMGKVTPAETKKHKGKVLTNTAGETVNEGLTYPLSATARKHKHSYRKDGTCACGNVKRQRKVKA